MKEQFEPTVNDLENIIKLKHNKHNECKQFIFSPAKKIIAPDLESIESIPGDPYEPTLKKVFSNGTSLCSYIIEGSTALQNYGESIFLDQNTKNKEITFTTGEPSYEKNKRALKQSLIKNFGTDIAKAFTIIMGSIVIDVCVPPPGPEVLLGVGASSYYFKTAYNKIRFLVSSTDKIQFIYDPDLKQVEQAIANNNNTQALEFLDEVDGIENNRYLEKYRYFAGTLSPKKFRPLLGFWDRGIEGKKLLKEPTKKYVCLKFQQCKNSIIDVFHSKNSY